MAIVTCIVCNKKISSKSKVCTHCGANFSEDGSVQNLESATAIDKVKRSRRLQGFSFIAVIIFILGALLALYEDTVTMVMNKNWGTNLAFGSEVLSAAQFILALGFVGYIVTRFMMYFNKKK